MLAGQGCFRDLREIQARCCKAAADRGGRAAQLGDGWGSPPQPLRCRPARLGKRGISSWWFNARPKKNPLLLMSPPHITLSCPREPGSAFPTGRIQTGTFHGVARTNRVINRFLHSCRGIISHQNQRGALG